MPLVYLKKAKSTTNEIRGCLISLLHCEEEEMLGVRRVHNSVAHHLALYCMFNFGLNGTAARFQFERLSCERVLVLLTLRTCQKTEP